MEVELKWSVRIPMRDGAHLSATLYLPRERSSPAPTLFTMTPYIGQSYHDVGLYFAARGYPCLTVDVRGRGNSDGSFHPAHEAKDGYDVVEWLARQAYCDGKVALWGGSYSGYVQWAAAKEFPPHLATIVPVASPYRGVDSPMRNNFFFPGTVQWLTLLSGHTSQEKIFADQAFWRQKFRRWLESGRPFQELDTFLGLPSPLFQEWLAQPRQNEYWDSYNPTAQEYSKLVIPILTITGIYDGDQPGALAHYCQHMQNASPAGRAQHYLIIGPWDHAGTRSPQPEFCGIKVGPASLVDLGKLHTEWYAWTMQNGKKPEFLQKNVAYYVMGAEEWRYADTLEAVTSTTKSLYLQSTTNPTDVFKSGSLEPDRPAAQSEPDHYTYDPRDVSLAALESTVDPENRVDQRMVHAAAGRQLVYHSAPFEDDVEICGFFKLTVWLSLDQPDTDFAASVYEIGIDGSAIQLSRDSMRARYRESFREEKLIRTAEPLRYDFERFMFVARRVKKGNRLRLVFGPVHSIYVQKNYNSGGVLAEECMLDARTVLVKLFHDESHPSALHIPIGEVECK